VLIVYRQPIALDRFTLYDVVPPDAAVSAGSSSAAVKSPHPSRAARETQRSSGGFSAEHGLDHYTAIQTYTWIVCHSP